MSHEGEDTVGAMGKLGLPVTDRGRHIVSALASVTDPEIPVVNVFDMGMIAGVRMKGDAVEVDLMPTFAGCPALDVIRGDITRALIAAGEPNVIVRIVFDPPWTSDRITAEGRRNLKAFGLAPPPGRVGTAHPATDQPHREGEGADLVPLTVRGHAFDAHADFAPCPFCDSRNTQMESLFGPTLCRAIHYCHACRQSFEQFKHV